MSHPWQEHSLSLAPQRSGFGTPNVSIPAFRYLLADKPKVQFATETVDLDLMSGKIGAAAEKLVGRRHGTLQFSMPLEGFKSGYDPTAEDPGDAGVVPYWFAILANVLGSHVGIGFATDDEFWNGKHLSCSEYQAGKLTSATSTTLTVDDDPSALKIKVGQFVAAALAANTGEVEVGFVKQKAMDVLTLFDAAGKTVNDGAANLYGSANAWISDELPDQIPLTAHWVGERVEAGYVLSDLVCTGFKLSWNAGEVPNIEFSFNFYDYQADKTLGGLVVPTAFARIPQIVGANNGRAMLGQYTGSPAAFGTALQCGLESCSIEYKVEIAEVKCHAAQQGIAAVSYRKPRVTVQVSVPWSSTDEIRNAAGTPGDSGSHKWQSMFELGQPVSIGVYVGSRIGRLFGFLVPAGRITAVPQVVDLNGQVGYQLTVEAGAYTGDTSDQLTETPIVCPIDSLFRAALS